MRRLGLKTDEVLSERVGRALFGEPMDATAQKLAGQLASSMDKLRVRADVAGMNIPKRKDFGLPQVHDVSRIASAPKNEWVEYTAPRVKRIYGEQGVLENPNHIRGYLEKVYDAAVEDAATLQSGIRSGELKLQSESRRIIFRNYNDRSEYSQRFGHGEKNQLNIVASHLPDLSTQTALVEILGPRPRETLNKLMDTAAKKGQLTPLQRNRIERLYSVVSGEADGVQSQRLANTGAFIRSWLASAQLGSAPISAMSDIVTGSMARKANGMPLTRGLRNLFTGMSRPEAARMAIAADASLLQLQHSKFGDFAGASKGAGRGADFTLRASGLTAWTKAGRRSFGVELLNFLGNHVKSQTPFAKLPRSLQRQLPRYGIQPQHWDNVVLKAATIQKHGASFLDLDSFGSLVKDLDVGKPIREAAKTLEASDKLIVGQHPKAAVRARLAEQHGKATEIQQRLQTIRDVEIHLREMLATESEFAMISGGDARVKALTTCGAERGTLLGELGRTGLLYKSFSLSLLFTHLQRGLHQPTMAGKVGYLGPFIAASTIVGALSIQARELAKGRTPRRMDEPSFWIDALSQGGALTVFEGALEANRGFDRVVTQAGGPGLGLARDVFDLTAKNAIQASKSKDAHVGREVSRFAERYTPGTNLWQSRLITQRFIWNNLQRMLDPEAEESFAKQAAAPEKWGSEYWWAPGE